MGKATQERAPSSLASHPASTPLRALILEDNPRDAELYVQVLTREGFELQADVVDTEEAFLAKLQSQVYDIILSDYRVPGWTGVEAFRLHRQIGKDVPFIIVTGTLGEEAAVDIMKEGVTDYVLKERLTRLPTAVRRALEEKMNREERERAIRALRESEERVRLLLDSTAEAICGIDLQGGCTFINSACVRILGYDNPEDLLGKRLHRLAHHTRPDGTPYPAEECPISKGIRQGKPAHVDTEVYWRKDGTSFPVEYWSYPMHRDGKPVGAVVTFIDISERKKAHERFYKAFNANPEPITITGISDGRYLDVNESFLRVTGYSREEIIGRTSAELKFWDRPEDREKLLTMLEKYGSVRAMEIAFQTKSGERRTGLGSAGVIETAGQKCLIAFFQDITERKSLEKQLRQAQKMEAIGQLAGGIAHDFNNLLGVIIGYSEIFEERLHQQDPLKPKAEQIKKAGQRAAVLTRQLLAFSRQQVLEPKVLDLNAVVADTLKMLQRLIGEDIELVTAPAPDLGRVKADQGQIEQIIMNLAVNARDAMPQGGKLTITTANADLDDVYVRQHLAGAPGPHVMLQVSDTGCGMDRETQARIFEPFFTTKELGKGTGLGLSTVYGVVKQSGGYIWVYSEPGRGTTFKIYLPRVDQLVTRAEPSGVAQEDAKGTETILVVEDALALRELTRELLESQGYTVLEASDGAEALRVAEKHPGPIHLLLTDVVMPGMDGRVLAESMAHSHPDLKVLYASGYTDDAILRHGVLDSKIALLQKPFTKENLTRKVREVLGADEKQPEK